MAFITQDKNTPQEEVKALFKPLSTIGSDPTADITIRDADVADVAAFITRQRLGYEIKSISPGQSILVQGQKITTHHLKDGDQIRVGNTDLIFHHEFPPVDAKKTTSKKNTREVDAYKRVLNFTAKLSEKSDVPELLTTLLDEVIQLTNAEKGFLVLVEESESTIKVARNSSQKNIENEPIEKSWTIVQKVLDTQKPLVINDAKRDTQFNATKSVINYKLTSIICVPLIFQSNTLGVIYVDNNTFASVFDDYALEVLKIFAAQAALIVKKALQVDSLNQEAAALKEKLEYTRYGEIIGSCAHMQAVFRDIEKIAQSEIGVLITGETGTGKELIARELHRRSPRKNGPFVVINCGAIPEELLESELFGHVKGAFTGAVQTRVGKFQAANRGTLFLDEIGEMPLHLQVKILRVLQERAVTKVGANDSGTIDIRILAATNRDLLKMVSNGSFREDLFYRLNVIQIQAPPLRERGNDILVIANYLLQKYAKLYQKSISGFTEGAQNALLNYRWPGNVRQLENRIKRAMVLCEGSRIQAADLDLETSQNELLNTLSEATEQFRQRYINDALERNANNRTKAARELGIDPRTIFRHLQGEKSRAD